ncbi:NlpC/P60 family protein [Modicisalibacter sp. 'Wilcox']|uniref:C40 family peptidase n=1 Tax=Modicisalibacter sp. 'Wilcox' TaxID=2679914 RepID=UPI001F089676|nr:NlpC/P60 family protein [Modicisalibacter sp. 'Wilcox']
MSALAMAGLLAGCAATPSTQSAAPRESAAGPSPRSDGPADRLAEQVLRFRRASPGLVREALLDEHERWVGTPYVLGGDSRHGIDCSALMQRIFSEAFAVTLPRTTDDQVREGEQVTRDDLKAGDLVFFRPPGPYNHVGVYVGSGRFLHASTSRGVKLSRLDNVYWRRYYWQARRPLPRVELAQRWLLARE